MSLNFKLPSQFDWVDLSNDEFNTALEATIKTEDNLFIQSRAGCGKSLIIKIACQMLKNVAVVAPTGSAAVQLQADGIPSGTLHSFFQLPPTTIIDQDVIFKPMYKKQRELIKKLDVIIMDEVSMISSHIFDTVIMKISHIRGGDLPRFILFGDVFQLPPVVNDRDDVVYDFYQKNYNGKIMFFNSGLYDDLNFKVLQMNHSFRQADPEFADNILKIGLGTATQETLDYFNQKVCSWPEYEKTHKRYMYLASTRKEVKSMNDIYLDWLKGDEVVFKTEKSPGFPDNIKDFDEDIVLKEGAQVIFTQNNKAQNHVNGTIGTITSLDNSGANVELEDGTNSRASYSKFEIYEPYVDSSTGLIKNRIKAWVWSIDCKVCKAMTINKSQGKTFDDAYIALGGWIQQGGLYVALSRLTSLNGLGLSRPIKMGDMIINNESKEFFEKLENEKKAKEAAETPKE